MKKALLFLAFFIGIGYFLSAQTTQDLFEQGNAHYAKQNYEQALNSYNKIIDAGEHSAALYFNMANAHYKLNHIAPSIYFYEKALLLNPDDSTIKENLSFAQKMTIDAISPMPQNVLSRWYHGLLYTFKIDGWATITVLGFMAFALLFIIYYFRGGTRSKRVLFTASVVSLGIGLLALVLAFQAVQKNENTVHAIVFAAESQVKNAPQSNGDEVFTLHEGTKLRVLESQQDWKRIRIADGTEGWILAEDVKTL